MKRTWLILVGMGLETVVRGKRPFPIQTGSVFHGITSVSVCRAFKTANRCQIQKIQPDFVGLIAIRASESRSKKFYDFFCREFR